MKHVNTKIIFGVIGFGIISLSLGSAQAIDLRDLKGQTVVDFKNGGLCVIPTHSVLEGKVDQDDQKDEINLCSMNFSGVGLVSAPTGNPKLDQKLGFGSENSDDFGRGKVVNLEPKLNSTNPGVLIVDPDKPDSKEAKFKNSITCSYAPAAIASYHISRILEGGRAPVSVARTMGKSMHQGIVDQALEKLGGRKGEIIYKTWAQFDGKHKSANDPKIFSNDGNWIFGALSKNVKKEYRYTEVSGVGAYDTRYLRFQQQTPFKRVADGNKSVLELAAAGSGDNVDLLKLAPVLVQMKDVSDMVLFDTLLNQDDRIGNIHMKLRWYVQGEDGSLSEESANDQTDAIDAKFRESGRKSHAGSASDESLMKVSQELNPFPGKQATLVREMILKDNDCGGDVDIRSNQMRANSVLEQVRHMSPKTYTNFMEFAAYVEDLEPANADAFFRETFMYRDKDIGERGATRGRTLRANIVKARSILLEACNANKLRLDLDTANLKKPIAERDMELFSDKGGERCKAINESLAEKK